jgi:hypothetical protein
VISLRYHIVSLVAVFLALALGIVVGSTVLQEGTVSVLRATSDRVREESDRNSRDNVALNQEISRLQGFGATVLPELVRDRLKGRSVVLVDTDKVDSGTRDSVRKVLEDAGAEVDGQITFADERLALAADADRAAMGRLLAADAGAEVLRGELVKRLAERLATPAAMPQDDSQRASEMLTGLQDADFLADLKLSRPMAAGTEAFPRPGSIFVLLGPGATASAAVAPDAFLVPLADQVSNRASSGPVVGAEAAAVPRESSWVIALRDNRAVSRRVSGIDSVDKVYGQLALVQALQGSLQQLPAGQYGTKDGASGLLPERIEGS